MIYIEPLKQARAYAKFRLPVLSSMLKEDGEFSQNSCRFGWNVLGSPPDSFTLIAPSLSHDVFIHSPFICLFLINIKHLQ